MRAFLRIATAGFSLSGFLQADGAVVNAHSMSREDVGSAVASARDGDTVVVPPGKADWKSTLTVNKAITLQFAGSGQSVILDDIIPQRADGNPVWSQAVISFSTQRNKLYRLTGLEIDKGLARTNRFFTGTVQFAGSTTGFRVDHCSFAQVLNNQIYTSDSTCGVIDHCVFRMEGNLHAVLVTHALWAGQRYGDGSWVTPAEWGTSNAVYIEDCLFTNATSQAWRPIDSWSGARWVFRHNQVFNANLSAHGTESGGRNRGTRSCEIYLNQFHDANIWPNTMEMRSATAVVWSNTASGGYRTLCSLDDYRSTDYYKFWGRDDGMNPLDKNEPGPVLVVSHTGPAGSPDLIVGGAHWKANQWAGYNVVDANEAGETNFGMIYSNTATTAFLMGPGVHPHTVFNTGDTVKFYKVKYALDMPGMGQCGPLKRDAQGNPLGPWPNQQVEPIYSWGNTLNGADAGATTRNAMIVEGVNYFNDTPKPGYTPFTYPHPLAISP